MTATGFRLKAFGVHLLASVGALSLLLGALYLGWYRWPGWYLADASQVVLVMAGVDLVVGPLLTLVVAAESKPRRTLARDVAVIAVVQLSALVYGTLSLWNGRPLYYAFSENVLQLVQAYDIDAREMELARRLNVPLIPHWYSLPRWIWAPLPEDPAEHAKIMPKDKQILKEKMRAAGYSPDRANAIPLTGRGRPLLAIVDPASTRVVAIIKVK